MVRVNLIHPKKLADQHLIAEYNEILMLAAYIKNNPKTEDIPNFYCLGKGHMKFFKDKLVYLKNRHEALKKEMNNRKFKTNKTLNLNRFRKINKKDWIPTKTDLKIIKERIFIKINLKPNYYRYYSKYKPSKFFINLIK